jgi:large subunit ribosomal protein L22
MSVARGTRKYKVGEEVSTAQSRFQHVSERKARAVADLIRGLSVAEAQQQLMFTHRPSAQPIVSNLLKSAIANARNNEDFSDDPETLIVGTITVDGGSMLKRFRPRAMGRASAIRKRTSHLIIKLNKQA